MAILIAVIFSIAITAGIISGYFTGVGLLRNFIGESQREISSLLADNISDMVDKEIEGARVMATSETLRKAAIESNLRYKNMGEQEVLRQILETAKKWDSAETSAPLVNEFYKDEASSALRSAFSEKENIFDVILTDRFGALLGASNRPSSFYYGDKDWWKGAFDKKRGKLFIGAVTSNKAKDTWLLPVAVPVRDEDGEVVGIYAKFISIDKFFKPIAKFNIQKTGNAALVDDKGYLVFHPSAKSFKNKFSSYEALQKAIQSPNRWCVMDTVYLHTGKTFAAFSEVDNPRLLAGGTKWRVFVTQDVLEALTPVYKFVIRSVFTRAILVLLVLVAGYMLSGHFLRPIVCLRKAMDLVSAGDFGYKVKITTKDELGLLSQHFNEMTDAIKHEWQMTIDAMPEAVFVIDKNHVILKANANFIKMLRLKEGDVIGRKCYEVLHKLKKPWPSCPAERAMVIKDKQVVEIDDPAIGIPLLVTVSPIFDKNGEYRGAIHIAKDISPEKKAAEDIEERSRKLQKVEGIKKDLLLTVAELAKPLSVIDQELKHISREKGARLIEREQKTIEEAALEIDRLMRCISSLTEIGKLEIKADSLKEEMIDFKDLIRKHLFAYEPKVMGKGLELKTDIPKGDLRIYCDRSKIGIVISSLMENSIKFTNKGHIEIVVKDLKDSVEFSIADTGIGISREDMGKVFGRMQQLSHVEDPLRKATGLSLSLCKEIIEAHDGAMWVESESGVGSKFIFTLPKRKEP